MNTVSLPSPYYQEEKTGITLYHGDCREILPLLPTVDVVLTDPPYPKEFPPLYAPVFSHCDGILSPNGLCFALCGQNDLPFVLSSFPASWRYIWCGCFLVQGSRVPIWPKGISSGWKPLLIYGKTAHKFKHCKFDVVCPSSGNDASKSNHKWGQDEGAFETIISRFDLNGVILDPFMGGGTTIVAAKKMRCRGAIGVEIEERYCEVAANRLRQMPEPLPLGPVVYTTPIQSNLFGQEAA